MPSAQAAWARPNGVAVGIDGQYLHLPRVYAEVKTIYPLPKYNIEMIKDRTIEQERKIVAKIIRVCFDVLGGVPESVVILITDVKRRSEIS